MLISAFQARDFLYSDSEFYASLDLGRTKSKIIKEKDKFLLPDGQRLSGEAIKEIMKKETICFLIRDNEVIPASIFSQETNRYYKLVPTGYKSPPTIEISGIRMHVTKEMDPYEDTIKKLSFASPIAGRVLDSCTGLGYTAIESAKSAEEVYTYEIDSNVIELQKINPWSADLFNNQKIKRHCGDIFNEIKTLKADYFDIILHDPPRLSLASLLYSREFYDQLHRVAKDGCRLYHYTGQPGSRNRGIDLQKNVMERLEKAGFRGLSRVFNGVTGRK